MRYALSVTHQLQWTSVYAVKQHQKTLGLSGSRSEAIKNLDSNAATQLVLQELDKDLANRMGVHTIQAKIACISSSVSKWLAFKTEIFLLTIGMIFSNVVSDLMHIHAREALIAVSQQIQSSKGTSWNTPLLGW